MEPGELSILIEVLTFIIGTIVLITFFVMAARLGAIKKYLKNLHDLEFRKPENQIKITCKKCSTEFTCSVLRRGYESDCPKCGLSNE